MLPVFVLVLGGAILLGVSNILIGYFFVKKMDVNVMVVGSMLGGGVFGTLAFGAQASIFGIPKISSGFWIPFAITILLATVIEYAGIKSFQIKKDISLAAAIQGLTPIFVIFTSLIIVKELPTPIGLIGILTIAAGIYFFKWEKGETTEIPRLLKKIIPGKLQSAVNVYTAPLFRLFASKSARLALLSAFCGSLALPLGKRMVINSSPTIQTAAQFLTVSLVVYAIAKITGRWKKAIRFNNDFRIAFTIGMLIGLAEVLFSSGYLFGFGIVPYVGTLKRFHIIVTAILAAIFLKVPYGRSKIIAAAVTLAGIVLIAF
ncbi:MAG: EamA family transporter [Patescibacteria group bacterium]